jgi:hypothetical protein
MESFEKLPSEELEKEGFKAAAGGWANGFRSLVFPNCATLRFPGLVVKWLPTAPFQTETHLKQSTGSQFWHSFSESMHSLPVELMADEF